jgi:transcription initiation factor TFIIIB Brf1 subunit/transcription initiation factor TFIIB
LASPRGIIRAVNPVPRSFPCPQCGATMAFDAARGKLACAACRCALANEPIDEGA